MHTNLCRAALVATFGVLSAAPVAQAQLPRPHLAVGGVGSTLGLGGDVAVGLGRYVVLRGSMTAGSIGVNQTVEDQAYNLFAKADNQSFMLDIHPFGGGIFVSAGVVKNRSLLRLTGQPASDGTYTFNGQSYAADSIGTLSGLITLPSNPLFFGFGWDHSIGNAWPVSLHSRLGVLRQDAARLALSVSGPFGQASNPNSAAFLAQLEAERARQELSLDRSVVRNLPVVELGIRMRLF